MSWSSKWVERPRISWGAIFGGAVTALGLWILPLCVWPRGRVVDTRSRATRAARARPGYSPAAWALIAPLIALFIGGWVAGRGRQHPCAWRGCCARAGDVGADDVDRRVDDRGRDVRSRRRRGVGRQGRGQRRRQRDRRGRHLAPATRRSGSVSIPRTRSVRSMNACVPRANPRITPAQLQATTRDVGADGGSRREAGPRDGDRRPCPAHQPVARRRGTNRRRHPGTGSTDGSGRLATAAGGGATRAQTGALKVGDATGKAFWGVFGALLMGLIAALAGGAVGASREPGRSARRVRGGRVPSPLPRRARCHP